jgi:hypothetical protein
LHPPPPRIPSEYPVTYWADVQIGTIGQGLGLKNFGNTCYMNSTIQCLSATVPFARFFTGELFAFFLLYMINRGAFNVCLPKTVGGRALLIWSTRWGPRATLCTHFRVSCTNYGMGRCRISRPFNSACAHPCFTFQFQGLIFALALRLPACCAVWRFRAAGFTRVSELLA